MLMICRIGILCVDSMQKLYKAVNAIISSFNKCTAVHSAKACLFQIEVRHIVIGNAYYINR